MFTPLTKHNNKTNKTKNNNNKLNKTKQIAISTRILFTNADLKISDLKLLVLQQKFLIIMEMKLMRGKVRTLFILI